MLSRKVKWINQQPPIRLGQPPSFKKDVSQELRPLKPSRTTPSFPARAHSQDMHFKPRNPQIKTLEIPIISALTAALSMALWYITGEHEKAKLSSMVSMVDFVNKYLRCGKVDRLQVINADHIRVVLKPAAATETVLDRICQLIHTKVSSSAGPSDPVKRPGLRQSLYKKLVSIIGAEDFLDTSRCVRFKVGDVAQLESLLKLYTPHMPPVYYVSSTDRIRFLRGLLPMVIIGSLMCCSITWTAQDKPDDAILKVKKDYFDLQSPPPHFPPQIPDKLAKFGQASIKHTIPNVKFADVAGLKQAKIEICEFVDFLKNPAKFTALGASMPKGALLVGPPGTGKTLLAKAVAGEASVPFFSTSGSDFIEMFVGVGASRIRDLFDKARKNAPSIIFIDEIDTIGRLRSGKKDASNGGTDERESTLNALLVELDGFNTTDGIVVLAGTNRGDVLDGALTRPGRFDRQIALSMPNLQERVEIFKIHLRPLKLQTSEHLPAIAKRLAALTPGFSGAEIRSVCNEAAIYAARNDMAYVTITEFERAVERLIGGLKHSGDVLDTEMRKHVAIHEAGHAICGWYLPQADPVLKLSIVPRANGALGYTQHLPDEILLTKKEKLEDKICVLLGGRAAEHIYCNSITTGASDDLDKATRLAQAYVSVYGFDRVLGLRSYQSRGSGFFPYSDSTARQIDERVHQLLQYQWSRCCDLIKSKGKEVKGIADELLCNDMITVQDLERILGPCNKKHNNSARLFIDALP